MAGKTTKLDLGGSGRAVIIGAGYVGMEMAHVLTARGLEVEVLEKTPQILPGWHSDSVSLVEETLKRNGVEVHTGVEVVEAEADADGRVASVITSGERHAAELVLVATRRARQLANGKDAFLEWENDKPTVMALREIAEGEISREVMDSIDQASIAAEEALDVEPEVPEES